MTKAEKNGVLSLPAMAYYSGFGGIEIKSIVLYDMIDYVVFVAGAWCSSKTAHRKRIYYTHSGNDYFLYKGIRIHLNECVRCDIP